MGGWEQSERYRLQCEGLVRTVIMLTERIEHLEDELSRANRRSASPDNSWPPKAAAVHLHESKLDSKHGVFKVKHEEEQSAYSFDIHQAGAAPVGSQESEA